MRTVRIFLSSPGDVGKERDKAAEIFERLQAEFSGRLLIDAYFWENEPIRAHTDPQTQIEPPSRFDLFVCILWARLGSRLHPALHRKPGGAEYASGTEYEVLDALAAYERSKAPQVLIYKRKTDPFIPPKPKDKRQQLLDQYDALEDFVVRLTKENEFFVRGKNSYASLSEFERIFETHMRKVLEGFIVPGAAVSRILRSWTLGSPFRGLRHFDFDDSPIFFGRTRAIEEILDALKQQAADDHAFVVIFGASGIGKSSLARAGVLPSLTKPGLIDGVGLWRRSIMRPTEMNEGDIFDSLAAVLLRAEALPEIGSDGTSVSKIATMLRDNPDGLAMLIKGALSQAARDVQIKEKLDEQPRALFALVIDQIEELFTVERVAKQREHFLRAIDALTRSGYVWVIATLRSDFYSRCETSPLLMKLKQGTGQYHLQPPDEIEFGQMIRLPAAAAGLLFEEDSSTGERLDDLLRDAAVGNPAALPLLEFALEELYEQRNRAMDLLELQTYRRIGGVEGALRTKAEESFLSSSEGARESFDAVFRQLVTIGGGQSGPAVRRRSAKRDLEVTPGSRELIDRLVTDRLLIADRTEDGIEVISIAHEAMLKSWSRLADWVVQHRESLKVRAQVDEDASRWTENDRNPDYLYAGGLPLDKAVVEMEANFLNEEEKSFVLASVIKLERQRLFTSLASGEGILENAGRIYTKFPEAHLQVLTDALENTAPRVRRNTAWLLGEQPRSELFNELVRSVIADPNEEVRRAAAAGLVKLNKEELFSPVIEKITNGTASAEVIRALTEIRVAADATETLSVFDTLFRKLNGGLRLRIRFQSWLLRFKRGLPVLTILLFPAVLLSALSAAAFKWFPGMLNYALCQADSGVAMGLFHGVTAAFIWGGGITLGLAIYRVVFAKEHTAKSYLRPFPAVATGALVGLFTSGLLLLLICTVYGRDTLVTMGWLIDSNELSSAKFGRVLFFETRFAWPYLVMGTFLGIGMALMINGLRASARWAQFLGQQTPLSGMRDTTRLLGRLTRVAIRFAWPIPFALLIAGAIAFSIVRSAPTSARWSDSPTEALTAGLSRYPKKVHEWKVSPWGQGLGIIGDGATQVIGGFFALVGLGLGTVIIRCGINVEPQKN